MDPDADFNPHHEAGSLIDDLHKLSRQGDAEVQDCAAVLPGVIDALTVQAKAGALDPEVFRNVLGIDARDDAATYRAKLKALAEIVAVGPFSADMTAAATTALDVWKTAQSGDAPPVPD